MISTLDDFVREYTKITQKGWIKTHRDGPTGIGKTLEDELGIPENNIQGPDFGDYELKSSRIDSNSMLTMFTRSPKPRGSNTVLRTKYGYSSGIYDNEEKVLHTTLSANSFTIIANTGHKLKITCQSEGVFIESEDGIENAFWSRDDLKKSFEKKYKNKFILARAESRGIGSEEEFHFIDAYEINGFSYDKFIKLLEQGKVYVDLRIGQYHSGTNAGKTHDHGTGFRIKDEDQHLLFSEVRRIV